MLTFDPDHCDDDDGPEELFPEDVTRESIRAVIAGHSANDEILRDRDQLEEAVNTIVAVEYMADDPDANREIIEAIVLHPEAFPGANKILNRFVDLAVEDSRNWLTRERQKDRIEAEERQAELAHEFGWKY